MKRKQTNKLRSCLRFMRRQRHILYRHISRLPLRKPVGLWRFSRRVQIIIVALVILAGAIPPTLLRPRGAHAASVGPNSPTTAATTVNGTSTDWTNPTNVYTQNSTYAAVTLAAGATSYNLNATGFGFNINSGAVINGVSVTVYKFAPSVSKITIEDANIQLMKAGVAGGTSEATTTAWPTANGAVNYGGTSDLWGNTLTASDVNNSGFGVSLAVKSVAGSGAKSSNTASVDYVSITVTYTLNSTFNQASYRTFNNQDTSTKTNFITTTLPVGSTNAGTTTGDFNGDGKQDFATANWGGKTITIDTNNGAGGFTASTISGLTSGPLDIVSADFNGDGVPDLATGNGTANNIYIFLNNGSGTFTLSSTVAGVANGDDSYIVAADFTGDGKPDLAVSNYSTSNVSIFTNSGTGTFTLSSSPAVGSFPEGLTAADLTGDGKIDLAVANKNDGDVSILTNSGTGTFTLSSSPAVGSSPGSITSRDLNGDGKVDLAVVDLVAGSGATTILLNNGTGSFSVSSNPAVPGPASVTTADFNGDGAYDLAVAGNNSGGYVYVLLNDGSGNFTNSSSTTVGGGPNYINSADFNGDGKPDLVESNGSDSTDSVLLFSNPIDVGGPLAVQNTAATAPGDGRAFRLRMDIGISTANLAANSQSFKLQYAPMTTSCDINFANTLSTAYKDVTATSTVQYYDNPNAASGVSLITDANDPSDGTNTTANSGSGSTATGNGNVVPETYQEKGTTTFTNPNAINVGQDGMWDFALTTNGTTGGQHYCLRMVIGNGTTFGSSNYTVIPEIIIPATNLNQASYRMFNNQDANAGSGPSFGAKTDYATGTVPCAVAVGDFNGDGKQDIVTANNGTATISVLLGDGTGGFGAKIDSNTGAAPSGIAVGDINGDSKLDVVVSDNNLGHVITLFGDGTGHFGAPVSDQTVNATPEGLALGDFNGDGKLDVAYADDLNGEVGIYLGDGTGYYTGGSAYMVTFGFNYGITTGDFNGDGKLDVVATDENGGPVEVGLGDGTGKLSTPTDLTVGTSTFMAAVGDFNGDGKQDIVTASNGSDAASIFLGNGAGNFGAKTDFTVGTAPWGVVAEDFNGDGKLDVVTTNSGANTVSILPGTGTGSFAAKTDLTVGTTPEGIATGDFNGDGKLDVVVTNSGDSTASVLLNTTGLSIDVGTALANQNTAATAPGDGQPFRMRVDVGASLSGIAASGQSFKLQYAPMTTSCDTSFTNTSSASYTDVTTASTVRYYDNPVATNGTSFNPNINDPTDGSNTLVRQTYQEFGTTSFTNASAISAGQDGMWDFALTTSGTASGQHYCLRLVTGSGSTLSSYTVIPEIMMPGSGNSAPNFPTSLAQAKADNTVIPTSGWLNATSVKLTASATDPDASDTEQLCVEAQPIATGFTNAETACGSGVAYSGTAVTVTVTLTGLTDATQYHWQARTKDAGGLYSSWVSYGGNVETASDYGIDTTAPIGGTVYDGTSTGTDASFNDGSLSSLSANWSGVNTNVSGIAGYEYSIGTTAGATDVKGWTSNGVTTSLTATGLTLHTSNKYFINIRTTDNAGNQSIISSDGQFVAPSVSFSVSPSIVTFAKLNTSNSYTDTKATTLTTSTNAYGGYVIRNLMTDLLRSNGNKTIPDFTGGTYAVPDSWQPGDVGFGYTSSDTSVQGTNKFQSATCLGGSALAAPGCYAPFSHTSPGDIVADNTNAVSGAPITNEQFTITYRITTANTQPATTYNASAVYSITPAY